MPATSPQALRCSCGSPWPHASAILLSTTSLISQEVGVIRLRWVLPLGVYLLTFIICFGDERWYRRRIFHTLYALAFSAALVVLSASAPHILIQITIFCVALFAVCMVCHGELVRRKPASELLSSFCGADCASYFSTILGISA